MYLVKEMDREKENKRVGEREEDGIGDGCDEQQEHQNLATPSRTRTMLGPTPQKDGVVLGLFDLLSPSVSISNGAGNASTRAGVGVGAGLNTAITTTPSRRDRSQLREVTGNSIASLQLTTTPRKNRYGAFGGSGANCGENVLDADYENEFVSRKGSRTPASVGKRFLLDSFVTPRKRRRCDGDHGLGSADATPSSVAKRFMTPQFLRREAPVMVLDALIEDDGAGTAFGEGLGGLDMKVGPSPRRARQPWKRKGLTRSLSSMIQGMRKQEDERLDQEMDIMNDIEGGGGGGSALPKAKKSSINDDVGDKEATTVVAESQIASTLDADGLVKLAEDDDRTAVGRGRGREGDVAVPARKKKGQKRQTRRVIRELHPQLYHSSTMYDSFAHMLSQSVLSKVKLPSSNKNHILLLRTKTKSLKAGPVMMMIMMMK